MNNNTGRRAGILLSMSSLPGRVGSYALGAEAFKFVDFLADAGQSLWQILPIGPVGKSLSPYQSRSAFAGNPAFIDKEALRKDPERYAPTGAHFARFLKENENWLYDYALFEAVRVSQAERPLYFWPDELRNPSAKTLSGLKDKFQTQIEAVILEQYCFFSQWRALKRYANLKGVGFIGDLPIYVYEDSAEFWLRRGIFDVDTKGRPRTSAGVPPDAFSKDGQIWNNPVYAWNKNEKGIFDFWRERLTQAARLYDGVRIDHFRALADYYVVPANRDPSGRYISCAGEGEWRRGPGKPFTDMIRKEYPGLYVIAEDLGEMSEAALALVTESGFPGMKVIQFAFSGNPGNPYLPHNIPQNAACYTGTHDNDTLAGWLHSATRKERVYAMEYFGLSSAEDLPSAMLAAVLASRADTAIVPLQDWLELGSEARMNKPGVVSKNNWKWRCPPAALSSRLSKRIRCSTKDFYGR